MTVPVPSYDAIVLAGGGSRRLGADKTRVRIGGRTVLERVFDAVADAELRLVVGAEQSGLDAPPVHWLREDPPGGGPAAGIAAALPHVHADAVVVLAGDLPYVDAGTVGRLLTELTAGRDDAAGAVLQDGSGRPQWLTAAVRTAALRNQIATQVDWGGAAMHELFRPLELAPVAAVGEETHDIDTPEDIPSQP